MPHWCQKSDSTEKTVEEKLEMRLGGGKRSCAARLSNRDGERNSVVRLAWSPAGACRLLFWRTGHVTCQQLRLISRSEIAEIEEPRNQCRNLNAPQTLRDRQRLDAAALGLVFVAAAPFQSVSG
ncbi:hypothetical protein SRHO_G00210270 [Serrasalmus rhombeus]